METRVPTVDDADFIDVVFRCACLQAGVTPEAWMTSRRAIDEVGLRVGTMTKKFAALTDEQKISGLEAIKNYVQERGR
jgi:hypothetical protein